jgi:Thioredoxin-like
MYGLLFPGTRKRRSSLLPLLALALATSLNAQAPPAQPNPAQPPAPDEHQPPVSAKISNLSHRLLAVGLKANALGGDGLKPWHIKIDYTMPAQPGTSKPVTGTVEEWHSGPYQWRRDFTGTIQGTTGSEWSVSKLERYETKNEQHYIGRRLITLRVARPVIDPLYQSVNIQPDYPMEASRVKLDPLLLTCLSVVNPRQYAEDTNPDWLFPTMCFDSETHLHITNAGDTAVQFDDIQPFQNRAVARHVTVTEHGATIAEMHVTLLEPWDAASANPDLMKPTQDAVLEPFKREPGMPLPVSVYEVGAHIPMNAGQLPPRGYATIRILIQKDGSVKVDPWQAGFMSTLVQNIVDAIKNAISQWKYKPYIVDGQPVEVEYSVTYIIDGKPFVASYDRPKPPASAGPNDYSSVFDYKRDPAKDLEMAKADAAKAHKRILMEVGGTWCSWCTVMDKFFVEHTDLRQLRDDNFVFLRVNMSPQNENVAFLGQYPRIPGYPWIFVLDADGKLITSKSTNDLEAPGSTYSKKSFSDFLTSAKGQ